MLLAVVVHGIVGDVLSIDFILISVFIFKMKNNEYNIIRIPSKLAKKDLYINTKAWQKLKCEINWLNILHLRKIFLQGRYFYFLNIKSYAFPIFRVDS